MTILHLKLDFTCIVQKKTLYSNDITVNNYLTYLRHRQQFVFNSTVDVHKIVSIVQKSKSNQSYIDKQQRSMKPERETLSCSTIVKNQTVSFRLVYFAQRLNYVHR